MLGIAEELAERLTLFGGVSADMIIDMPTEFLTASLDITEDAANSILSRAREIVSGIPSVSPSTGEQEAVDAEAPPEAESRDELATEPEGANAASRD